MSGTITLYELYEMTGWMRKKKGEFRQIRWCKVHKSSIPSESSPDADYDICWAWGETWEDADCLIVDKWLEV